MSIKLFAESFLTLGSFLTLDFKLALALGFNISWLFFSVFILSSFI